jgi:hypothetical protein
MQNTEITAGQTLKDVSQASGREGRSDGFEDRCPSEEREETEARVRTNKYTEADNNRSLFEWRLH